MVKENSVSKLLLMEINRRLFDECFPRMHRCLNMVSEEQIWYRPNKESNSLGNLVLHLAGNLRQWVGSTLGGQEDLRRRQSEFDARSSLSRAELKTLLDTVQVEMVDIISNVTEEDLLKDFAVQGFQENGVAILVHITEHFSYHVGQATYLVKMVTGQATDYYAGQNLDATD